MATMREVAALAGVSAKTVSRVINGDRYVSNQVRERVQAAVDRLNYVPNMLAQTFRSGRDSAIGVAVPSLTDPFFATVVDAVAEHARSSQKAVLISTLGENPADERPAVETLLHRHVAGLILVPVSTDHRYIKPWLSATAVVFVDRPPQHVVADSVIGDDEGGADQAVTHLLDAGHRRVAFVGNSAALHTTERRLAGYRSALARHGIPADPSIEVREREPERQLAGLTRVVTENPTLTAIFCANAHISIRLLPELHARGLGHLAFVSFGDFAMADSLRPTVTAVDQNPALVGETAVRRLFDRIDHPEQRRRRQLVLPVELRVRESSRPAPVLVRNAG